KLESYPQQSAIAFRAVSEFVTEAELEPLGELDGRSVLPVPTGDFNGYGLRTCTEAELGAMYQIPIDGFHCGDLALDESSLSIPFRLPVELLYRSLFICGAKGSGKTTCLRSLLPNSLDAAKGTLVAPSIVILDVEGEFSDPVISQRFAPIGVNPQLMRLSTDPDVATVTLGLGQVHY